jgi:hypothetical protein
VFHGAAVLSSFMTMGLTPADMAMRDMKDCSETSLQRILDYFGLIDIKLYFN